MDLSRAVYSRDLKIAAMRALDTGSTIAEIARKYQLSPKLLERWRGEWRGQGGFAVSRIGGPGGSLSAGGDAPRTRRAGRRIGQLPTANDYLKKIRQKKSWVDSGSGSLPSE